MAFYIPLLLACWQWITASIFSVCGFISDICADGVLSMVKQALAQSRDYSTRFFAPLAEPIILNNEDSTPQNGTRLSSLRMLLPTE